MVPVRTLCLFVALSWALWAAPGILAADRRPNVLLIVADDLNNHLGCYGHPLVRSPNIDRLAGRGIRFDRAYCQYPVCNASRTSFLSGRRPGTTGIVDNFTPPRTFLGDAVFLPQHFRSMGYHTIKVGKIFHTGQEFEDPRSWDTDIVETRQAKTPPPAQIVRRQGMSGIVLKAADKDTYDGQVARQAAQWMEKTAGERKPFFLAVGFRRPHTPYLAPEKYFALYPPEKMVLPQEPAEHLKAIPPIALTPKPPELKSEQKRRATMAAYYASVTFMDTQVGVLLEALDRLKLWEDTVVILMSDHGYHLGEHGGFWHKMSLFEESARVPLVVAAPGKKANATCAGLVELIDLYPTLIELCGLKPAAGLEGKGFVPLLDDPSRPGKTAAFTVVSRARLGDTQKLDPAKMGYSVRTPRHRYTWWFDGSQELYDHNGDPREYRNLADRPDRAAVVARLRRVIEEELKKKK